MMAEGLADTYNLGGGSTFGNVAVRIKPIQLIPVIPEA